MSVRAEAPGELDVIRRFVNTFDVEEDAESLVSPAALREWLAANDLPAPADLGADDVARAIAVREALRALLVANGGGPLDAAAMPTLNDVAESARLVVRFGDGGGSALAPVGGGVDAALGALLAIVFSSMAEGSWSRLKACGEHSCRWAFYDRSRNRSGTWCSMEVCGNRAKARSYRRRNKA